MRNLALARSLGVLAILVLPTIVLFGWWMLAVAGALAIAADAVRPRRTTHGDSSRLRQGYEALRRRLSPHSWRPGGR